MIQSTASVPNRNSPLLNSLAIAIAFLSLATETTGLQAETDINSGNFWMAECSANTQVCGSYIKGMRDMNSMFQAKGKGAMFCPPVSEPTGDLNQVIVNYMTINPQYLNQPFILIATTALARYFPCPR